MINIADYTDNYNNIKNAFEILFSQVDLSTRLIAFKQIEFQINDYLSRYTTISAGIKERYEILAQQDPNMSESARRYQAIKSYNQQVNNIENLLKEGYLYVDAIRQAFTGESISYQIGMQQNNSLYEGTIDILDLIQHSTLDVDSKIAISNAAKLRITKISVTELNNSFQSSIIDVTNSASSAYSAVFNYFTDSHNVPKRNLGNAYEVYRRYLMNRKGENRIPPPIDYKEIDQIYSEVKRNNAAYYKGGDIADIQVKYLSGKPPSLTSLASIKRVLTNTKKALNIAYANTKPKTKIVNSFANLLTQKESTLITDTEKAANKLAQETIKQRLISLLGIASIT